MEKDEALKILFKSADTYEKHLKNKNLLIIYADATRECKFFETRFLIRHFKHLTGVETELSSRELYKRLLSRRLSVNDFSLNPDGTTEMKLRVLPQLFSFGLYVRMVAELDYGAVMKLRTEKLAGGNVACIGFVQDEGYYSPNTVINADIRKMALNPPYRILAILEKNVKSERYNQLIYTARGFEFKNVIAYEEICDLLEFPVKDVL